MTTSLIQDAQARQEALDALTYLVPFERNAAFDQYQRWRPRQDSATLVRVVDIDEARDMPCHTGIRLLSGRSSALGRVNAEKRVQLVRGDREAFGLHGRSAEQRVALDLLLDDSVGIVSLGGKAGTGKSALALCAGLEAV